MLLCFCYLPFILIRLSGRHGNESNEKIKSSYTLNTFQMAKTAMLNKLQDALFMGMFRHNLSMIR